jgi:hypothetical protein
MVSSISYNSNSVESKVIEEGSTLWFGRGMGMRRRK